MQPAWARPSADSSLRNAKPSRPRPPGSAIACPLGHLQYTKTAPAAPSIGGIVVSSLGCVTSVLLG